MAGAKITMETFNFDHEPSFAELWELCNNKLLYDAASYGDELANLLTNKGLGKHSAIADVAAGSGFPALELSKRGFDIKCTDGFQDEVDLFNKRAEELKLAVRCDKIVWNDLPKRYAKNSLEFVLCRGNSFIYADGGWNSLITIKAEGALKSYAETAAIFFDLLKPGGFLYIDKFKDSETTHKEKVLTIKINDNDPEDLIFWTEREKIRRASMVRRKATGEESGVPNITYDLAFPELRWILKSVGFSKIEDIALSSEKHFDILFAQK